VLNNELYNDKKRQKTLDKIEKITMIFNNNNVEYRIDTSDNKQHIVVLDNVATSFDIKDNKLLFKRHDVIQKELTI